MQILGAIGHVIRVSEPKTETPIGGLNSSSSKTKRTRGIKVSNLEASGHALSALKNKLRRFRHCLFFLFCLFIYLLSKSHYGDKYSKTTKARNLKFGQMISLNMNLCASNFAGATSNGLGQILNLRQRSLLRDFSQARARAAVAEWLKRQWLKPKTYVQLSTWLWLLSNQDDIKSSILIFFFD